MRRLAFMVIVHLVVLVVSSSARAEQILLVVGGAALKPGEQADLVAVSKAALDVAGWALIHPSPERTSRVLRCVDEPTSKCLGPILGEASADRAVVIRVTNEDPKDRSSLQVRGWIFRSTGELLVGSNKECAPCRKERLKEIVAEQTTSMVQRARARTRPATLVIHSVPDGATIYIDGEAVGATDFSYGVYAGKHTVRLKRDGYREEVREVSVTDGERVPIDVELHPIESAKGGPRSDQIGNPPPPPPPPPPPSRLLPWLTIGAGAAATLAGVGVLLLDESNGPTGDRAVDRRETTVAGLSIAGAGVVGVTVGVVWLLRTRQTSGGVSPRPTAGVSRSGAWLGLQGRF
jgi:hypothetical protein